MSTPAPDSSRRKGCKGCLIAAAVFAAVPVFLFAAYVGWGIYANDRAERESKAFCDAIRIGDPIARVDELARGEHAPKNRFETEDGFRYMYYGMIYTARECRVHLVEGRVTARELIVHED